MNLSYLSWRREQSLGEAGRIGENAVYRLAAVLTVVSFIFFSFTLLPRAYYPEFVFHRPEEFVPAVFFLLALICYIKKGEWRHDHFEHWLVMSIIVGFLGQVIFMSFSGHLFDFMFDAAHLLKKVSYVLFLTGLLVSMFHLFRQAEENAYELEVSADELREANERLEVVGRIARDLGSSLHEKDLFPTISREIRRIIPCERLFIGSVNFETEEVYYWHIESDVKVPQVESDDVSRLEWYRELYEKSSPLTYGDLRKVPYRRAQDFANAGILSQLVVPIERDGKCADHIALSSTRVDAFSGDQVEQLISLSGHINVALQNSMLHQAAEERAERLEIVGEIARAVGSELEPNEVLTTVINEIRNVVSCDRIVIACLDPEKESYDWYHYFEHEDVQKNSDTYEHMGRGLVPRKAYFEKQPYIIPDLAEKPWRDSLHFKRGYRSTIVTPILQENRCVAHLQLSSQEMGAFSKEQESLLTSIASHLGGAIRNAALFQEARRNRYFLDSVIRDNADAIFICNTDREIIDWNLGADNLYGYRKDEMLGKSVGILFPKDGTDPSRSETVMQTNKPVIFEANRLKKGGSLVPVSITNSPVRNHEGIIIALSAVHKDLTMQVVAEEEIRSLNADLEKRIEEVSSHAQRLELSEAQFRALFDSAQDAVIAIDEEGFITLFNQAAERMFEYTSDEIVGRKINLLMPSPYSEEHDAHLDAYRLTGVRKAIGIVRALEGRSKSGEIFPIELSVGEVVVGDKRLYTGILRDITERNEIDRMKN